MANLGVANLLLVVTSPLAPASGTALGNVTSKGSPQNTGTAAPYRCRVKVSFILLIKNLVIPDAILLVRAVTRM